MAFLKERVGTGISAIGGILVWMLCVASPYAFESERNAGGRTIQSPSPGTIPDEDGYKLWNRYPRIADTAYHKSCSGSVTGIVIQGTSPTMIAVGNELTGGLKGLLGTTIASGTAVAKPGAVCAGTPGNSPLIKSLQLDTALAGLGNDGYLIRAVTIDSKPCFVIAAQSDAGVLYGSFAFLRLIQTGRPLFGLNVSERPRIAYRLLNHWDNIDGSIERGYAGKSLWKWDQLPATVDPRYTDYARANASIGINGVVLNNVNADPVILTAPYLGKVAALADVFRPYGIRVFLSAQFSAPKTIGGLPTADPLDQGVISWWKSKADEIYSYIPDFGGFLVKANSEGQPGPKDYGRTHAEGANVLARALKPHNGIVIWRAFVYGTSADRTKEPYEAFKPLDGQFDGNAVVQIKNGPLDFQPREPVSPLFGAMHKTGIALELQITQEYCGQSTHMNFLGTMWKEICGFDTYAKGKGSTVARVVDGSIFGNAPSVIAGVANTGDSRNWCGHHLAQANWYAFGRLAWNPNGTEEAILDEWIAMTFGADPQVVTTLKEMLLRSYERYVNYTMPLGLNMLVDRGTHFDPDPANRKEFHRADAAGIGFDRSPSGSNAVAQYFEENRTMFATPKTCPEKFLLWFHHVPWKYKVSSTNTVIKELFCRYDSYKPNLQSCIDGFQSLDGRIDSRRFTEIKQKLERQFTHAKKWRDVCVDYFSKVSNVPYSDDYVPASGSKARPGRATLKLWINNYPTVFDLPETIASPITECVVAVYTLSGKRLFSWSPNKPGRIPEVMDLREMFERYPSGNYICTLRVNKTPLPSRRVYFMD